MKQVVRAENQTPGLVGAAGFRYGYGDAVASRGRWESWWHAESEKGKLSLSLLLGALAGLALGLFAYGYMVLLQHFPGTAEIIRKAREQMATIPGVRISYAVMAIGFAPFAEEYLFRGLLFRALDHEWGGWRAVLAARLSSPFIILRCPGCPWHCSAPRTP